MFLAIGLGTGAYFGVQEWHQAKGQETASSGSPWFAAYVDATATPHFAFEQMGSTSHKNVVLSFVVALKTDKCTPSWGGVYTLDQAGERLDLDRRIERLRQQGGNIAVSFGGLLNDELAVACQDRAALKDAYRQVIERYQLDTIDLDLEMGGLTDTEAGYRRSIVLAELQKEYREAGKNLAVWLTLPVLPQGLTEDGTNAITRLIESNLDIAGVNVMTMNYGQSRGNQNMLEASKNALNNTKRQLDILYQRAEKHLTDSALWAKIGATPMIGQNDIPDEVFTVEDAKAFNEFARSKGINRMSMWSANRDIECGSNYVNLKIVSTSCSGIKQNKFDFSATLGLGFEADLSNSASKVTEYDDKPLEQEPDDPATSPYQIWSETGAYLQGTKVVWHRNVYQAKWWTQGDMPDNPVLQSWQTPWELIGPVLPGEKPIPQATLPAGTYPEWSGNTEYEATTRVLFEGVPYQAKWWTKGDSPAASSSNPTNSPWAPLTQEQINEILKKND